MNIQSAMIAALPLLMLGCAEPPGQQQRSNACGNSATEMARENNVANEQAAQPDAAVLGEFNGVRVGATLDGAELVIGQGELAGKTLILNYWMSN